jgi:hypothetical protein
MTRAAGLGLPLALRVAEAHRADLPTARVDTGW